MNNRETSVDNLTKIIRSTVDGGFVHIIISSFLVKVVSFISVILLPRIISEKADYGLLVYVDNIRNYVLLINGLGIANASIRYCTKEQNEQKRKGYFLVTLLIGIVFDVILICLTIIAFLIVPIQFVGASNLLILSSLLPLFAFLFEDIQLFLRACFENEKYSLLGFVFAITMAILQIGLAILWQLEGVIIGRYIATVISIIVGVYFLRSIPVLKIKAVFPTKDEVVSMVKFGITMMLSNSTSLLLQLNETFIIAAILKNEIALAEYRIASYMIVISTFLVQSVAIFVFPHFTKNMDDKKWVWDNFKKLTLLNVVAMIPLHIVLIFIAEPFIRIVFGEQYLNAVPIMQTLLIASLGLTTLRLITGNVLAATGEETFNLRINVVFLVLHALLDVWAISTFGIYGAAIALTIVYYLSGGIMIIHLRRVCVG